MTILVTGATGYLGRRVVRQLVEAGEPVRALTRSPAAASALLPPGTEVVVGDLADPPSLVPALDGADRLYLFPVPDTARQVVELAVAAGVQRVVVLSSGAVTTGDDHDFHLPVEQAVEASAMAWTHLRCGEFASNALRLWGPQIRVGRRVAEPFPDAVGMPTHEADFADVAVAALLGDGHAGAAYTVVGPDALTRLRQVEAISAALGEPVALDVVTAEQAREVYRRQGGWAAANADFLLGFVDYSGADRSSSAAAAAADADADADAESDDDSTGQDAGSSVSGWDFSGRTAEAVTGRPARTFAQWARDHADDFR